MTETAPKICLTQECCFVSNPLNKEPFAYTKLLLKYHVFLNNKLCDFCTTTEKGTMQFMKDKNEPDGRMKCTKCKKRQSPRIGTFLQSINILLIF